MIFKIIYCNRLHKFFNFPLNMPEELWDKNLQILLK